MFPLIFEGSPTMLIWRNLDPKLLAQLLVQASAIWKARRADPKQDGRLSGRSQPAPPRRVRRMGADDA